MVISLSIAADRPKMMPPSTCAVGGIGVDDVAAVHGGKDVSHAELSVRRHRDVRDLGDDGAEALGDRDAAAFALPAAGCSQSAIAATFSSAARKRG